MSDNKMQRTIGVLTGLGILIGYVVGSSIFVTPGVLAATAGPSVWLAYTIAGILAFTICFVYAQIGTLVPVSGGIYIFSTITTTEYGGILYTLWNAACFLTGTPLMAITAATYLQVFFPSWDVQITALVILVLTFVMNIFGNILSSFLQTALLIVLIVIILIFGLGGITHADWSHFTPAFPVGVEPILLGVLTCYYSFTGFNILTEMAGEVKEPTKNIPRIVFLGFAIIMLMYILVCVGLVALKPASELGVGAPMVYAANAIFSGGWFGTAVAIAAICGAWTTVNACFLGLTRSFYQLGKSNVFPSVFAKLNKFGAPIYSLILFMILVSCTLFITDSITLLINTTSLFFMLIAVLLAIGSLRIRLTMGNLYDNAGYKLRGLQYYFWPAAAILSTGYFMVNFLIKNTNTLVMTVGVSAVGIIAYILRRNALKKQGIDIVEKMKESFQEQ